MKWQLLSLGLGWGIFLFKLYQQYRQCKQLYHNPYLSTQSNNQSKQIVVYDSDIKPILANAQLNEGNMPNSAVQIQKMEGNNIQLQHSQNNKKAQMSFQTTIDECDFVVFPQLYPHLRKRKNISKRLYLTKGTRQKNRLSIKRKRDTKKYKQWFITNKVLSEIRESGQFTNEQIQQHYSKITKEIKSTVIDGNKMNPSDSNRSQEGTDFSGNNVQFVSRKSLTQKDTTRQNKILSFLDQQDIYDNNSCKIVKYDPFQ